MRPNGHIPKPFKRTRVAIQPRTVYRTWQTVDSSTLAVGDTVADHGAIRQIDRHVGDESGRMIVEIEFQSGQVMIAGEGIDVFAFTEAQGG